MSEDKKTAQRGAATVAPVPKFRDMSWTQKLAHIGKLVLCVLTFGFLYPNAFIE